MSDFQYDVEINCILAEIEVEMASAFFDVRPRRNVLRNLYCLFFCGS